MSTSSSATRRQLWRADWVVTMAIVAAVVVLWKLTPFCEAVESRFDDAADSSSARAPSDRIAPIAIDDRSIANIGPWPWTREVHAGSIGKLAAAQARATAEKTPVAAAGAAAASGYDAAPEAAAGDSDEKTAVFGHPEEPAKPGNGPFDPQA